MIFVLSSRVARGVGRKASGWIGGSRRGRRSSLVGRGWSPRGRPPIFASPSPRLVLLLLILLLLPPLPPLSLALLHFAFSTVRLYWPRFSRSFSVSLSICRPLFSSHSPHSPARFPSFRPLSPSCTLRLPRQAARRPSVCPLSFLHVAFPSSVHRSTPCHPDPFPSSGFTLASLVFRLLSLVVSLCPSSLDVSLFHPFSRTPRFLLRCTRPPPRLTFYSLFVSIGCFLLCLSLFIPLILGSSFSPIPSISPFFTLCLFFATPSCYHSPSALLCAFSLSFLSHSLRPPPSPSFSLRKVALGFFILFLHAPLFENSSKNVHSITACNTLMVDDVSKGWKGTVVIGSKRQLRS